MPTFDLIKELWVPVIRRVAGDNGGSEDLGLIELLTQAHCLREVRDPLPTVEFGLYRLLVALVTDIFCPGTPGDLEAVLDTGHFEERRLEKYFTEWRDRFDLFDPAHPFLQSDGMDAEAEKPLAGLLHPFPSGTNVNHFHHAHEDDLGVCPAVAARLLGTIAPFMTAGGAGLAPSINGAPPWYVLVSRPGDSLFHTLCLNCLALHAGPVPADDAPAWRSDRAISSERSKGSGLLEGFTWRPRRIQLVPGPGGVCSLTGRESPVLVRAMKFAPGSSCEFLWRDPAVPYRTTEKGPAALRPQEGREIWRDTGPLALLREKDYASKDGKLRFERPAVVTQFAHLVQHDMLPDQSAPGAGRMLRLDVYGMRTDMKMKIFEWHHERLAVPGRLVWEGRFLGDAQRSIEEAESVAYCLKRAIKHAYPRDGKGNSGAFDSVIADAQRQFWSRLRPRYDALLYSLAAIPAAELDTGIQSCRAAWRDDLRRQGGDTLEGAIGGLDADSAALKRQVEARRIFWTAFGNVFALPGKSTSQKGKKQAPASPAATEGAIQP